MADTGISFVCDTCIPVLQHVFRTCPTFGSHWAVTRLRNFIKSGIYIAKHFVFMLIIFQVDRQSLSIRFFVFEKKNPITFEQKCTKPCYDTFRLYYPCAIIYLQNSQQKSQQNNVWVTANTDFCHESGNSALVTKKKSVFPEIHTLFYFLRAILCCYRVNKPAKTIIDCHSLICEVTWKRVIGIVTSYLSIVRERANSSLVNNNRGYRF